MPILLFYCSLIDWVTVHPVHKTSNTCGWMDKGCIWTKKTCSCHFQHRKWYFGVVRMCTHFRPENTWCFRENWGWHYFCYEVSLTVYDDLQFACMTIKDAFLNVILIDNLFLCFFFTLEAAFYVPAYVALFCPLLWSTLQSLFQY